VREAKEIRDCISCPPRATEELRGPLDDGLFLNVKIFARIRLRDVLTLSNQRKRSFGSFDALGFP
jgi:hypothetical protein